VAIETVFSFFWLIVFSFYGMENFKFLSKFESWKIKTRNCNLHRQFQIFFQVGLEQELGLKEVKIRSLLRIIRLVSNLTVLVPF